MLVPTHQPFHFATNGTSVHAQPGVDIHYVEIPPTTLQPSFSLLDPDRHKESEEPT